MDAYRTPDERFEGLPDFPFAPHFVEQDGLRMHYLDEGDGDPVLCLHGEPTWSFVYRKVIPPVARVARVVVPDYFGFGRSDKPLASEWYTYDAHTASIARFVEELDLRRVTLVVQDWGGPIGMRFALENSERVARLVVLNTGVGGGRAPSEAWLRFRELVRRTGVAEFQPGRLVRVSLVQPVDEAVIDAYDAPFPTPESKTGPVAFPEHVPTEPNHPNTAPMLAVREGMSHWEKPTLVLFGDSDPIFAPEVAHSIARLIPGAPDAEILAGGGHFVQEDCGEEVGERIARFLSETPLV